MSEFSTNHGYYDALVIILILIVAGSIISAIRARNVRERPRTGASRLSLASLLVGTVLAAAVVPLIFLGLNWYMFTLPLLARLCICVWDRSKHGRPGLGRDVALALLIITVSYLSASFVLNKGISDYTTAARPGLHYRGYSEADIAYATDSAKKLFSYAFGFTVVLILAAAVVPQLARQLFLGDAACQPRVSLDPPPSEATREALDHSASEDSDRKEPDPGICSSRPATEQRGIMRNIGWATVVPIALVGAVVVIGGLYVLLDPVRRAKPSSSAPKQAPAVVAEDPNPFYLGLQLSPGDSFTIESTTCQVDRVERIDAHYNSEYGPPKTGVIGITGRMVVGKMTSSGFTAEITFTKATFSCSDAGDHSGDFDYDSSRQQEAVPDVAKPIAALVGRSVSFRLTPGGCIADTAGVDELARSVVEDNLPEGPLREAGAWMMRQSLQAFLALQIGRFIGLLPSRTVRIDDCWDKTLVSQTVAPMQFRTRCRVAGHRQATATVAISSKIGPPEQSSAIDQGSVRSPRGDESGTVIYDETTGMIRSAQVNQDLTGNCTFVGIVEGCIGLQSSRSVALKVVPQLGQTRRPTRLANPTKLSHAGSAASGAPTSPGTEADACATSTKPSATDQQKREFLCAVRNGDTTVVKRLLNERDPMSLCRMSDPDGSNDTPLLVSAYRAPSLTMTRILLKAGADPDECVAGRPVLSWAARDPQNLPIMEAFLDAGADPNGGDLVWQLIMSINYTSVSDAELSTAVRRLAKRGVDFSARDEVTYSTVLDWLKRKDHSEQGRIYEKGYYRTEDALAEVCSRRANQPE